MPVHVINEANRCLQCKNPRCRMLGCPIQTNIPEVIRLFKENKMMEAAEILFENNPLSVVCSLVCNHENQCEGHCVRGIKGEPVHFSSIENYISDSCFERLDLSCAPSNGTGYSFEEYKGVVSGANNGADSLAYKMDRSAYYSLLFTAMQSDLYKDAKWNLNSPEFEALASYCKDSVPEKCLANWNDDNVKLPEDYKVIELQVEGIGTYISNVYSQGKNIYGYPSANGSHGVIVSVNSSAAISSQSQNKNGAWEFIKNMMSYDIQSIDPKYAFDSSINLKALKERGSMAIADYNRTVQEYKNMDSYALEKARMMGVVIPDKEIDQTATDAYLALLDKATDVYRIDRNILLITKEELPAYYTGQKDLNSVITIAQDRVQKVMDERG